MSNITERNVKILRLKLALTSYREWRHFQSLHSELVFGTAKAESSRVVYGAGSFAQGNRRRDCFIFR